MASFYVRSTDGSNGNTGAGWATAEGDIDGALDDATPPVAGDTLWVSDAHAFSATAAITWSMPTTASATPLRIICGDDVAEPPTALTTTGFETTNADAAFTIGGFGYVEGVGIRAGAGAGATSADIILGIGTTAYGLVFKNCPFWLNNTSATAVIIGPAAAATTDDGYAEFDGCDFRFGATTQVIRFRTGRQIFRNMTVNASGSAPTTLFTATAGGTHTTIVENSDLTGKTWTNLYLWQAACPSTLIVRNCKLIAGGNMTTGTHPGPGGPRLIVHRCANGDTQNYFYEAGWEGSVEYNSSIYLTAGAVDQDGANYSAKVVASANASLIHPCRSQENFYPITSTGSAITLTAELAVDGASVTMQNDDVWLELTAYTTSGVPTGTLQSSRVSTVIATPTTHTASTASWTGLNATNTRFKTSVTFTPAEKGYVAWRVCVGEASRTLYFDPSLTAS